MTVRIGTRASALALWQAEHVAGLLRRTHAGLEVDLVRIRTRGDAILDRPLNEVGGKGLFLKEIEDALLRGEVDLAVHSLKDVPAEVTPGLALAAFPEAEDPRDALVSRDGQGMAELGAGARLGTTSLRRACQLRARRPGVTIVPLRGNVDTRVRKVRTGEVDAAVLALAGLRRLGLASQVAEAFAVEDLLPAIGQGVIAVQARADDARVRALAEAIGHAPTAVRVRAERALGARLGGSCRVPLAGHARLSAGRLTVDGLVGRPDGSELIRDRVEGPAADAERLGAALGERLIARGGEAILRECG